EARAAVAEAEGGHGARLELEEHVEVEVVRGVEADEPAERVGSVAAGEVGLEVRQAHRSEDDAELPAGVEDGGPEERGAAERGARPGAADGRPLGRADAPHHVLDDLDGETVGEGGEEGA